MGPAAIVYVIMFSLVLEPSINEAHLICIVHQIICFF